ncbi:vomeronasal type-2 receptor 116-like isoform X2 [Acomys russatus]|uniref:vomeronasal type-2 receptor 116-like isoform X2 n=1 Tax=Acomys russatus TaxID=60746 RepID=UPI0021E29EF3|nr:vomeronasal type-2 receptor 116-like isoform X2 [Acomys russatus]
MFTLILFYLLLNTPLLEMSFIPSRCFWRMKKEEKDGELIEACFFSLRAVQWSVEKDYFSNLLDTLFHTDSHQFSLVLAFSVDEINQNPDLLPNISLVFEVPYFLSVSELKHLIHASGLHHLFPPNYDCIHALNCTVFLTGPNWEASVLFDTFMSSHESQQALQLTYGPFHPILNDYEQFPCIHQMAHEDTSLAMAMISFLLYFNWKWVGLAVSDNEQGTQFLSHLKREMEKDTICFAFVNMIPVNMVVYMSRAEVYYNQIMTSSTNVVILYGDTDSTLAVGFRMWESLGIQKTWVTTSQWDVPTSKRDFTLDSFHGTSAFAHHHGKISGFKNFVQTLNPLKYSDKYLARLKWMNFNCEASASNCKTMKNCSTNSSLEWLVAQTFDMAFSESCYDIYNAAHVVAHVIHKMILQHLENQLIENGKEYDYSCSKMHSLMRKTNFTSPNGDKVNMNQKEKFQKEYDIFYIWNLPQDFELKVKIGKFSPHFTPGQQFHLSEDMFEWATGSRQMLPSVCSADCHPGFRKFRQEGMPVCCFICIHCPENEISNGTNMDLCVKCPEDQYANTEQNHCIHKAVIFLGFEDPLGMALAILALCFSAFTALILGIFLKHNDTAIVKANNRSLSYILLMSLMFCFLCSLLFIGHPNSISCILQQITFGIVFTVAISTVLAKTITVVLAFKITTPARRMRYILVSGTLNYIILLCTLIQIILCSIWLGASPPTVDIDADSDHGHTIIVCHKGSVIAFYCVRGYLGCLALGSFTVAFLARNLADTFKEAKFLTFSMPVLCTVWITFLPVYHSTKGKFMVALEIFCISSSSAGMLGCIFVPKFYIILLRPDKNCLQKIREKSYS